MQIELIGCTSAGKSTLITGILQACYQQGIDIFLGDDFVLKQVRLNWIKSHLPRTLLVDLAALFACLVTWRKNLKFYLFATRTLYQLPISRYEKLNLLRNVLKKIGIYEIIRSRGNDEQVILVDEGVLQAAHNLFVHGSVDVNTEQISTFAGLIPLPDVIVYLRQPESILIDRITIRGHKRIPDRSSSNVTRFVKRAVTTFDELVQNPAVESKLLVVDGGEDVVVVAHDQDNPLFDLASKIIQSGITTSIINPLPGNTPAPRRYKISPPSSSLRELET